MRSLFARLRHAAMFFAAGAVVAYFFDPDAGPDRRRAMVEGLGDLRGTPSPPARLAATPAPDPVPGPAAAHG